MKQCTNCPGRSDHTTAECPFVRDDLYADSAQARAGTVAPRPLGQSAPLPYDWQAAQQRRELEHTQMRARVNAACDHLAQRLGMEPR